jgi:uncharacterized membrane protein YeiH
MLLASAAVAVAASVTATGAAEATGTIGSIISTAIPSIVASALPSVTTTVPVTEAPIVLPPSFEVAAIFAGALSGGMVAVNRKFDITGVVVLALFSGLGGGLIRDVLLQDMGIFAFESHFALLAVLTAALVAAFFYSVASKVRRVALVIDTASLALFCVVGADKALRAELTFVPAVLIGALTAVGGGVLRDLLIGSVPPQVLLRGSLTATAAAAGSLVYVTMVGWLDFEKSAALVVAGLVAFVLRAGSLYFGWESPAPVDLTPAVASVPRRVMRTGRRAFVWSRRAQVSEPPIADKPADEGDLPET